MKSRIAIISLFVTSALQAQPARQAPNLPDFDNKFLNFGFRIGLNTMDYRISHAKKLEADVERRFADVVNLNPGINVGMVSNFRINKYISLRILPGLAFGQRDLLFVNENGIVDKYPIELKSTYIEAPITIKFNGARMMNAKPYLVGGINIRYDLAKSKKDGMLINPLDVYWELGAGIDSYMSYFRFSTEFKISVGMLNILNPEGTGEYEDIYYTKVLSKLFSRIFVLSFYFE